ncbi:UNVERIFIED_CONTAM: hypothetical protein FKN15_001349 [Acipenser sinensis]
MTKDQQWGRLQQIPYLLFQSSVEMYGLVYITWRIKSTFNHQKAAQFKRCFVAGIVSPCEAFFFTIQNVIPAAGTEMISNSTEMWKGVHYERSTVRCSSVSLSTNGMGVPDVGNCVQFVLQQNKIPVYVFV